MQRGVSARFRGSVMRRNAESSVCVWKDSYILTFTLYFHEFGRLWARVSLDVDYFGWYLCLIGRLTEVVIPPDVRSRINSQFFCVEIHHEGFFTLALNAAETTQNPSILSHFILKGILCWQSNFTDLIKVKPLQIYLYCPPSLPNKERIWEMWHWDYILYYHTISLQYSLCSVFTKYEVTWHTVHLQEYCTVSHNAMRFTVYFYCSFYFIYYNNSDNKTCNTISQHWYKETIIISKKNLFIITFQSGVKYCLM